MWYKFYFLAEVRNLFVFAFMMISYLIGMMIGGNTYHDAQLFKFLSLSSLLLFFVYISLMGFVRVKFYKKIELINYKAKTDDPQIEVRILKFKLDNKPIRMPDSGDYQLSLRITDLKRLTKRFESTKTWVTINMREP